MVEAMLVHKRNTIQQLKHEAFHLELLQLTTPTNVVSQVVVRTILEHQVNLARRFKVLQHSRNIRMLEALQGQDFVVEYLSIFRGLRCEKVNHLNQINTQLP